MELTCNCSRQRRLESHIYQATTRLTPNHDLSFRHLLAKIEPSSFGTIGVSLSQR